MVMLSLQSSENPETAENSIWVPSTHTMAPSHLELQFQGINTFSRAQRAPGTHLGTQTYLKEKHPCTLY